MNLKSVAPALLLVMTLPVAAKVDPDVERQVGGVFSNACGNAAQPMVRLYGDTMSIEIGARKVAASKFRTLRKPPMSPAPADFKVAFEGDVPGGDGLLFVLTHNKDGLFVTIVGGAKSLAPLGPGIQGQRIRHCDPNRNALPGTPPPEAAMGPTALLDDPKFKTLYLKALGALAKEPWLSRMDGPAPANKRVKVAGQDYTLASVCKPHDCRDNNMVLLYGQAQSVVYVYVHTRKGGQTLGSPPPAVASELAQLWKKEWRSSAR